jgi:lipid-binding SYLF domain-containing protein
VLVFVAALQAQTTPTFRTEVTLVHADAEVVENGRILNGFTKSDFRILDEGKPQPIVQFSAGEEALDLILLFDISGSMQFVVSQVAAASRQAFQEIYGRGLMVCRGGDEFSGPWGAPSMIALEGGSFGLQLGGQATDFVLLVMNNRGAQSILSSKVKLGADASAAAGPKGRDTAAATDVTMRAEILSYSRSRGLFAGVSLEGSTLRPDNEANRKLYGKELHARDIVLHRAVRAPTSAKQLLSVLNAKSPRNRSQRG